MQYEFEQRIIYWYLTRARACAYVCACVYVCVKKTSTAPSHMTYKWVPTWFQVQNPSLKRTVRANDTFSVCDPHHFVQEVNFRVQNRVVGAQASCNFCLLLRADNSNDSSTCTWYGVVIYYEVGVDLYRLQRVWSLMCSFENDSGKLLIYLKRNRWKEIDSRYYIFNVSQTK